MPRSAYWAPEHPLVEELTSPDRLAQVERFKERCASLSDMERTDDSKDKNGVFIGAYALNPVNSKRLPIWISDYVLTSYGTGAIMAVPAHDQRDYDFARKYDLPIVEVVEGEREHPDKVFTGTGKSINSGFLDGLATPDAKEAIVSRLEQERLGTRSTGYRLRDWIFSRQRYWGEPIPVLLDEDNAPYPLDESELPLRLPELSDFQPRRGGSQPAQQGRRLVAGESSERQNPAQGNQHHAAMGGFLLVLPAFHGSA